MVTFFYMWSKNSCYGNSSFISNLIKIQIFYILLAPFKCCTSTCEFIVSPNLLPSSISLSYLISVLHCQPIDKNRMLRKNVRNFVLFYTTFTFIHVSSYVFICLFIQRHYRNFLIVCFHYQVCDIRSIVEN